MIKKEHVRKIVKDVGETFGLRNLGAEVNPFVDERGRLRNMIKKMLNGYKLSDPLVKREAPVTPALLRMVKKKAKSARDVFIAHLLIGTFFYTMWSCEYVAMPGEPRTRIITSDRIHFYRKKGKSTI